MALPSFVYDGLAEDPDNYQGFYPAAFSPDGRYIFSNIYRANGTLDRTTEAFTPAFDLDGFTSYAGAAIDNDGTVYLLESSTFDLYRLDNFGVSAPVLLEASVSTPCVANSMRLFVLPDASKRLVWLDGDPAGTPGLGSTDIRIYNIGTDTLTTVANLSDGVLVCQLLVQDSYGDVWAVSSTTEKLVFQRVIDAGAGSAAPDDNEITGLPTQPISIAVEAYHTPSGWFVVYGGGTDLYLLDENDFSIIEHRSYAANGGFLNAAIINASPFLIGIPPGETEFWLPGPNSYAATAYSDLHKITAADLTTSETRDISEWELGDTPDSGGGMVYSLHTRGAFVSMNVGGLQIDIRYLEDTGGGEDGDGPGDADDSVNLRVWGFSLDDHDFYVLRVGASLTLVYDLKTGQWAEWRSPGRTNWRAHVGQNWLGMGPDTIERGFGTDIVAGDDVTGTLYVLDPITGRDDRPETGSDLITRIAVGGVPMTGRDGARCNAVQLSISLGVPTQADASITLRTSDDLGHTWLNHGSLEIAAATYNQVVEWRALGLMRQPGRIFEFSDNGACIRLNGADMR